MASECFTASHAIASRLFDPTNKHVCVLRMNCFRGGLTDISAIKIMTARGIPCLNLGPCGGFRLCYQLCQTFDNKVTVDNKVTKQAMGLTEVVSATDLKTCWIHAGSSPGNEV